MQHRIRKYVSVRYNGIIPELGNIQGPTGKSEKIIQKP